MQNKTVYIDVDDTLVRTFGTKRIPMTHTIVFTKKLKNAGATLYCWSKAGGAYAKKIAEEFEIADCFDGFLTKPDIVIDDCLFDKWISKEIHPNACFALTVEELFKQ